ncbi:hypothetical protein HYW42_03015 [Candidatus Daviesbacteria bacterium]|nr:hypothetical protein [Candidatus Daviesbacteria bacterium]
MIPKLTAFILTHKVTVALGLVLAIAFMGGGVFLFNTFQKAQQEAPLEETEITFDAEGPYVKLFPRRDGNALVMQIQRIASYDSFAYAITYTDIDGIDRGAGHEDTWINIEKGKGEYEQEILFGSCSKNVCKYDQGVENGTLVLRIRKGNKASRMNLLWHLQKPDVALGNLTSGDNNFSYKLDQKREELALIGFTIINDVTGVPKLPNEKEVLGKVYSVNVSISKALPEGQAAVNLAENPPSDAKVARYNFSENKWVEYETKIDGSKLSAKADGEGIFAVLADKEK